MFALADSPSSRLGLLYCESFLLFIFGACRSPYHCFLEGKSWRIRRPPKEGGVQSNRSCPLRLSEWGAAI